MRRIIKDPDSEILRKHLTYISANSYNNKKIADLLLKEQKNFCAYTEEFMSVTDQYDIDHFDPTLKGSVEDSYYNWFLAKHKINKKKSNKWLKYQPILHPTSIDFEERIVYFEGDYFTKSDTDIEAQNLIDLLYLDNPALAIKRKQYIRRLKKDIEISKQDDKSFFIDFIRDTPSDIHYLRAIKEEFGIDLWPLLK